MNFTQNGNRQPSAKLDLQNKHLCMALMPLTVSRFHPNPNKHNTLAHEFAYFFAQSFKHKFAASPIDQPDLRLRTPDDLREGLHSLQALNRLANNLEDAMTAVSRVIAVLEGAVKESQIRRHAHPTTKWPFPDEVHDIIFKYAIASPYDLFVISQVSHEFRRIVFKYKEWSEELSSSRDISCRGNTDRLKLYLSRNPNAPITATIDSHDQFCNSFLTILLRHYARFEKIKVIGRDDRSMNAIAFEGYDFPILRGLYLYNALCVSRFRCWRMPRLAELALIATPLTSDILNGTYPDALKSLTIESPKADVNSALPERIHDLLRRAQVRSIRVFSFRVDFSVRVGQMFHPTLRPLPGVSLNSLGFLHLMFAFGTAAHFHVCAQVVENIRTPNLKRLYTSIVFGNETVAGSIAQEDMQRLFWKGNALPWLRELRMYMETRSVLGLRDSDTVNWQLAPIIAVYDDLRIFSLHTNIGSSVQTPLYNLKSLEDVKLGGAHFDHQESKDRFLSVVDPNHLLTEVREVV